MIFASLLLAPAAPAIQILFLGNSHTWSHVVHELVRQELGYRGRPATVKALSGGFLNDMAERAPTRAEVKDPRWDFVVLQGAKMSSSHRYVYSQRGPIELAQLAQGAGATPLLFAEWPRRNWNETAYILGIYNDISAATGARVVPVCRAWDYVLGKGLKVDLWAPDGNHSSEAGAVLAAMTLAEAIAPAQSARRNGKRRYTVRAQRTIDLDQSTFTLFLEAARRAAQHNKQSSTTEPGASSGARRFELFLPGDSSPL